MSFTLRCPKCGYPVGAGHHTQKRDERSEEWTAGEITHLSIHLESDPPVDKAHALGKNEEA